MDIRRALSCKQDESTRTYKDKRGFLESMGWIAFGWNPETEQRGLTYYFTDSKNSVKKFRAIINKVKPYLIPARDGFFTINIHGSYDSSPYLLGLDVAPNSKKCRVIKMRFGTDEVLKEFDALTPALEYAQELAFERMEHYD